MFSQSSVGGKRNHRDETCHWAMQRGNEKLMDYPGKRNLSPTLLSLAGKSVNMKLERILSNLTVYLELWLRLLSYNYLLFIRRMGRFVAV